MTRMRMTKNRAAADPVLNPFLKEASTELAVSGRFRINNIVRRNDKLKPHRDFIRQHIKVVRAILEDSFGPLTAITHEDGVAGKGMGAKAMGYVRAISKFSEIVDDSLAQRQRIVQGSGKAHNSLSGAIGQDTGVVRPMIETDLSVPALPKPEPILTLVHRAKKALTEALE